MPLFDYKCPCGVAIRDQHFSSWRDVPADIPCPVCDQRAAKQYGSPQVWGAICDRALIGAEIFEGTPLEGTDGVNPDLSPGEPGYYESTKAMVEVGG